MTKNVKRMYFLLIFLNFKVQIPQSIAYSVMTGLPPINGLYTTFFSMMFYTIFGTSRHFSAGTEAIASILTASAINKYQGVLYPASALSPNATLNGTQFLSTNISEARAIIAMAITLLVGLIQVYKY
jgi:MFS superfamily sulfate permease-like transporter